VISGVPVEGSSWVMLRKPLHPDHTALSGDVAVPKVPKAPEAQQQNKTRRRVAALVDIVLCSGWVWKNNEGCSPPFLVCPLQSVGACWCCGELWLNALFV
jgi:hypothetical protein